MLAPLKLNAHASPTLIGKWRTGIVISALVGSRFICHGCGLLVAKTLILSPLVAPVPRPCG